MRIYLLYLAVQLLVLLAKAGAADASLLGLAPGANGSVLLAGQPFRGVGVNYFDCFLRTLTKADDTSYDAGFSVLAEHKIPFARFCATGFWPRDMKLFQEDRAEYFRRLSGVVKSAEKHGVGLMPSLFWDRACIPDLVGEPLDAWGNPQSKTHAFMRDYVREVITRYNNSPAIWAWEFGNEFGLSADQPNAAEHRAPVWKDLGTALERSSRDDLTHDMLAVALTEFAKEVRRYDPHRLITSGDAFPRDSAWHNRHEKTWTKDTPEQFSEMLALTAPGEMNLISVHCYDGTLKRVGEAAAAAAKIGKPLFVGEFQVPKSDTPGARESFSEFLATLEKRRVPMSAVWVFDFNAQAKEFNVNATNSRAWQLDLLRAANERLTR
ncbi:MAG TPA: cellulase family glycosylhydrolase [Planctomycetota bacterium]|nr:cellulase family glycosylhydrolase [Planctomycetota bacterium]